MAAVHSAQSEELVDRVFKALASRPRRKILLLLAGGADTTGRSCCDSGEVCACDFSESLGLTPSTISHHMKILQEAELVTSRKEGLWVYYALRPEVLTAVAGELSALVSSCCAPGK